MSKLLLIVLLLVSIIGGSICPAYAGADKAPPPLLTLKVNPMVSMAPSTVQITVRIEPKAENRSVCVIAEGSMFRMSCWQLEGATARKTWQFSLKDLSAGEYLVRAVVSRANADDVSASTQMVITGGAGSLD